MILTAHKVSLSGGRRGVSDLSFRSDYAENQGRKPPWDFSGAPSFEKMEP